MVLPHGRHDILLLVVSSSLYKYFVGSVSTIMCSKYSVDTRNVYSYNEAMLLTVEPQSSLLKMMSLIVLCK